MNNYLTNLLPRIKQYSRRLDERELYVDKQWTFVAEDAIQEYTFLRDNRLIMSSNGSARVGRWELLPTGKLFIDRGVDCLTLDNLFVDDGLLLLSRGAGIEQPLVLFNPNIVPDGDVELYLEKKLEAQLLQGNRSLNYSSSKPLFKHFEGEPELEHIIEYCFSDKFIIKVNQRIKTKISPGDQILASTDPNLLKQKICYFGKHGCFEISPNGVIIKEVRQNPLRRIFLIIFFLSVCIAIIVMASSK